MSQEPRIREIERRMLLLDGAYERRAKAIAALQQGLFGFWQDQGRGITFPGPTPLTTVIQIYAYSETGTYSGAYVFQGATLLGQTNASGRLDIGVAPSAFVGGNVTIGPITIQGSDEATYDATDPGLFTQFVIPSTVYQQAHVPYAFAVPVYAKTTTLTANEGKVGPVTLTWLASGSGGGQWQYGISSSQVYNFPGCVSGCPAKTGVGIKMNMNAAPATFTAGGSLNYPRPEQIQYTSLGFPGQCPSTASGSFWDTPVLAANWIIGGTQVAQPLSVSWMSNAAGFLYCGNTYTMTITEP